MSIGNWIGGTRSCSKGAWDKPQKKEGMPGKAANEGRQVVAGISKDAQIRIGCLVLVLEGFFKDAPSM